MKEARFGIQRMSMEYGVWSIQDSGFRSQKSGAME